MLFILLVSNIFTFFYNVIFYLFFIIKTIDVGISKFKKRLIKLVDTQGKQNSTKNFI